MPFSRFEKLAPVKREHLLDVAAREFAIHGFADASINRILEPAQGQEATWVEETVSYSLGRGRAWQWLDHWLVNPFLQPIAAYKTGKALRRLQAIFAYPGAAMPVNNAA